MKSSIFLLFVVLGTFPAVAAAEIPCSDGNLECRENFIRDNLPPLHTPDLEDDHDRNVYNGIIDETNRGRALEAEEKNLDDALRQAAETSRWRFWEKPDREKIARLQSKRNEIIEKKYAAFNRPLPGRSSYTT